MAHFNQSSSTAIDAKGGQLFVESIGAGPDVLLVHSGITDRRMWDGQYGVLSGQFRVTRYDMRGFGRSSAIDGPFSHVEDLRQVIEDLDLDKPRVVAASLGGRVAIDLAIRAPGLFDRLLLVGPAIGGSGFDDPSLRACWDEMGAAWDDGDVERMIGIETRFWINGSGRPQGGADQPVIDRVLEMQRRIVELLPDDEDDNEVEEEFVAIDCLPSLDLPVLVVVGEHDVSDIHRNAKAIRLEAPNARVLTIPDTGHLPNMEAVEDFNRLAVAFLS